jgi:two-component system, cell cycle sensor histidine kinase and response regulator CckA
MSDVFRPLAPEQAAMLEASPNPVLVLDQQLRIRYVNTAAAAYGAVDASSLIGQYVWGRYPELRDSIFARAYESVLRDDRPIAFEEHQADRGRWRAVYAYPADGGVVAILEDITERRLAEQAIAASEEALARAQSLAAIGSWTLKRPNDMQLSAEAYRVLGLERTAQPLDMELIRSRMPAAQRAQVLDMLTRADHVGDIRLTTPFRRFDDRLVYLDLLVRVMHAEHGVPVHLYGTIQDVTDRVVASEALRRSEKTLRLAQEAANIGSFDRDLRTRETYWSDQLMRIVGLDPATVDPRRIGRDPALDFVHPEDRSIVESAFRRAIESGEKQVVRNRIVRTDGVVRHLLGSAMLVRDEQGEPARVVGTALDVTEQVADEAERQRLESQIQQAQKLESLGILAGGIAHDFNNLLVGILGNASLALLDLDPTHEAYGSISAIERAAQRAAELTRQLLAYAGKGRFVVEAIDASAAVHEMTALLRTAMGVNASMQLDLAPDLPAIEVDATQFRQVVMNLITNAADALGDQGGLITLRTGARFVGEEYLATCVPGTDAAPGHFVMIEVSDTGAGMDASTVARVFDPFFSTKFTGRGLGLAATLGIMRSHRGAIRVYSEVGKGTSFNLLFPASASTPRPSPGVRPSAWRAQGEVLIIDDEPSVLAVTSTLLTRKGFTTTTIDTGQRAVELFAADPARFSLVVLDLTMPGMDGQATFRALRELRSDVRVLLMSGYNEQEVTRLFVGRGLAGFLQKPFRADELYERVMTTLGIGRADG